MEQVEVEILALTISAQYGALRQGDILRTNADFAHHLVEDCMAAKYVGRANPPAAATDVQTSAQGAEALLAKPAAKVKPPKGANTAKDAKPADAVADPAAGAGDPATAAVTASADDVQTSAQGQDGAEAPPPVMPPQNAD